MKKGLLIAVFLSIIVFTYGCNTGVNSQNPGFQGQVASGNNRGSLAPDFSVKTIDGETLRLSEMTSEKPTVLYFFATWCPNCANDLAAASRVYPQYADKVNFLAIDIDRRESESTIASYRQRMNLQNVRFAAAKADILSKYGVTYTTTKFLIGKDGKILNKGVGTIGEGSWHQLFQSLSQ